MRYQVRLAPLVVRWLVSCASVHVSPQDLETVICSQASGDERLTSDLIIIRICASFLGHRFRRLERFLWLVSRLGRSRLLDSSGGNGARRIVVVRGFRCHVFFLRPLFFGSSWYSSGENGCCEADVVGSAGMQLFGR